MERTAVFASAKTKGSGFCNDERPLVAPPVPGALIVFYGFAKTTRFSGGLFCFKRKYCKFFCAVFSKEYHCATINKNDKI